MTLESLFTIIERLKDWPQIKKYQQEIGKFCLIHFNIIRRRYLGQTQSKKVLCRIIFGGS